jgi:hypothetical protein
MRNIQDRRTFETETASSGARWVPDRAGLAVDAPIGAAAIAAQMPEPVGELPGSSAQMRAPLRRSLFRL